MSEIILLAGLCGFGIFQALCTTAPMWDDDELGPVDETVPDAERV